MHTCTHTHALTKSTGCVESEERISTKIIYRKNRKCEGVTYWEEKGRNAMGWAITHKEIKKNLVPWRRKGRRGQGVSDATLTTFV